MFPLPLPAEITDEYDATNTVDNYEFWYNQNIRAITNENIETYTLSEEGNGWFRGTVTVNGNLIRSSSDDAIALNGKHVETKGTLQVSGNQIKSSSGQIAMYLNNQNVTINGILRLNSDVIESSYGTATIMLTGSMTTFAGAIVVGGSIQSPSGINQVAGDMAVLGNLSAATKAFDIPHPNKPNWRLQHGCLEGPEHAVFIRGRSTGPEVVFPSFWKNLVDPNTISVHITPLTADQQIDIMLWEDRVWCYEKNGNPLDYFYYIVATRRDISPLVIEYEPT